MKIITQPLARRNVMGWPSGASFSPLKISGLLLWLKADAITGLADGDAVTTWTDSSGNGNNATQGVAGNKPVYKTNIINGKPVVRFDGTIRYLSLASAISTIRTVFWVFKEDEPTVAPMAPVLGHSAQFDFHRHDAGNENWWANVGSAAAVVTGGVLRVNGTVTDGNATKVPNTMSICSLVTTGDADADQILKDRFFPERNWDGDVAELIIYSAALGAAQISRVESYLSVKYAISL